MMFDKGERMICPLCGDTVLSVCFEKTDAKALKKIYYQCGRCKLVFLDPDLRLEPAAEKAVYDFHQNSPENDGYVRFLKKLADPLSLRLPENASGLDFGCGPGPTMKGILDRMGFTVSNYDPFYFPEKDLLNHSYDFVICTEVVEHFFYPAKEFMLIDRLLKPGGLFGLMTQLLPKKTEYEDWWYLRDPTHVAVYCEKTFYWLASRMGWTLEKNENGVVIYSK